MADEAGSSSAGAATSRKRLSMDFDVFLNFHGPDSRFIVVDVIYDALVRAGVRVFYDDESMRQEGGIRVLMEAITNSKIYILIFSNDYASSQWCLRDLEAIMKCWEASQKQGEDKTILPIFYDVDVTTDLTLKLEAYSSSLEKHRVELGEHVVKPWEEALQKAATIKGYDVRDHGLTKVTELVAEEVCSKLRTRSEPKNVTDEYVGINDPVKHIMELLDLDAHDVRCVAIHGVGGVGKTTLAGLVFNKISPNFRAVAFLSDICEKSHTAGIVNLQKDLISQLSKENPFDLSNADQAVNMIKERLKGKKVLIVLDDLDSSDQLYKLIGQPSWLDVGSRIIITTRSIGMIPKGDGFYPYEMQGMKFDDALKLFSRRVFESDSPPKKYNKIARDAVHTAGELPLAINVIAPLFRYKYAQGVAFEKLKEEVHKDEEEATTSKTASNRNFDVFLSFKGADVRFTVADAIYEALARAGVWVFRDDEDMRFGEHLERQLWEAIINSKIYMPIFSKDYASSHWCLRELELIMKCWKDSQEQKDKKMIIPIFYDVDRRTDLKLKPGSSYKAALEKHAKNHSKDVVEWENALKEAAEIEGWNVSDHGLPDVLKLIVEEVCRNLGTRDDPEKVIDEYVGMDKPMQDIMKLMDLHAHDVRFVTIHGIVGIGKTTLARLVFHKISSKFPDGVAFLSVSDVREKSSTSSVVNLQKNLLSQLLNVDPSDITNADEGVNWIKEKLKKKKVLIVLDDLDKRDQLSKLAGETSWFGIGSRIIVTTRNNGIMPKGEGFYQYTMMSMKSDDALKLFSRRVFNSDSPPEDKRDITRKVVDTTRGRPLLISAVASLFINKDKDDEWKALLEMLEVDPENVGEKLMMSYTKLDSYIKEIFLDIACLFEGKEIEDATYYWEARKLYPKSAIMVLKNMDFIEIDGNLLKNKDLHRELGRNLVDGEDNIPERRSRLWSPEKALSAVHSQEGTRNVVALKLGKLDSNCKFNQKQFAGFENLMFLELDSGSFENEDFKKIFSKLSWLSWDNCPAEFGATNLCFKNLNVLILSENLITDDWGGWSEIKAAKDLKVLKCTNCHHLMKSPDFFAFKQLERLVFNFCGMLREIDQSIGTLGHLTYLEFTSLFRMETLPDSIGGLKSLSVLKLKHVLILKLPASIGELQNLNYLCLWCPKLKELPETVGNLKLLAHLDISHTQITKLPESVSNLESLTVFKCDGCPCLKDVPDNIKRLIPLPPFDPSNTEETEILKDK